MARNKRRTPRACLAATFSILLALGGLPAPALAEMSEGVPNPVESGIVANGVMREVSAPVAASGLVYNGTEQIGVPEGEGYTITGNVATDAGDYIATATLEDGFTWDDGSANSKSIAWSIGRKPVVVKPTDATKVFGNPDPELEAVVEGLTQDDMVSYELSRESGEGAGTYEIAASGNPVQGNYNVEYETGLLTIVVGESNNLGDTSASELLAPNLISTNSDDLALASDELALTSGSLTSVDRTLQAGTQVIGTFTIPTNAFGYVQVTGENLHVALARDGVTFDEWEFDNHYSFSGMKGPFAFRRGGYQVIVTAKSGSSSGHLAKIGYSNVGAPNNLVMNNMEAEPNDGITSANALTVGEYVYGTICHGDETILAWDDDYFSFTLTKRQSVKLEVAATCYGPACAISVRDASGAIVRNKGTMLSWGGASEAMNEANINGALLDCGNLDAGKYYVCMTNNAMITSLDGIDKDAAGRQWYRFKAIVAEPVVEADASCALLRSDGSMWYCSSTGQPVTSGKKSDNGVRTLFIAADVTSLTTKVYYQFRNVEKVVFLLDSSGRNACRNIGKDAFYNCSNLSSVVNLEKTYVAQLGEYAFAYCESLPSIGIPPTLRTISNGAFEYCYSLSALPGLERSSLVDMGYFAFEHCSSLRSIVLPASFRTMGTGAFEYCSMLTSVELRSTSRVTFSAGPFDESPLDELSRANGAKIIVPAGLYRAYLDSINTWNNYRNHIWASPGWSKIGSNWYYGLNGLPAMGWLKDGGDWYYLDPSTTAMRTGWCKVGSTWYLLAGNGKMLTGWQKVGGSWYYLQPSGAMATGWQKVGNTWYLLAGGGQMLTGWQKVGGKWYYFAGSGAMVTGWLKLGSTWYYLNGSGAMVTGRQNIGGRWYTFNASGAWVA